MYRLINVNNPRITLEQSKELVTLFEKLSNSEYKYATPVIVNESNEIVAGHESAWSWSKSKSFKVTA